MRYNNEIQHTTTAQQNKTKQPTNNIIDAQQHFLPPNHDPVGPAGGTRDCAENKKKMNKNYEMKTKFLFNKNKPKNRIKINSKFTHVVLRNLRELTKQKL
jgi:hypothetical protein